MIYVIKSSMGIPDIDDTFEKRQKRLGLTGAKTRNNGAFGQAADATHSVKIEPKSNRNKNKKRASRHLSDDSAIRLSLDEDTPETEDEFFDHLPYPSVPSLNSLQRDLSNSTITLSNPLWKTHSAFKKIDAEIAKTCHLLMDWLGNDVDQNPLIHEDVGNFNDAMGKVLVLLRTSYYCRRKIMAMEIDSYLGDHEDIELECTDMVLQTMMEWFEYILLGMFSYFSYYSRKFFLFSYTLIMTHVHLYIRRLHVG